MLFTEALLTIRLPLSLEFTQHLFFVCLVELDLGWLRNRSL